MLSAGIWYPNGSKALLFVQLKMEHQLVLPQKTVESKIAKVAKTNIDEKYTRLTQTQPTDEQLLVSATTFQRARHIIKI